MNKWTTLGMALLMLGILKAQEAEVQVGKVLDAWHQAAAAADYDTYFGYMGPNAVFIGTDATENWKGEEFREFSKPYFDKGKAWSFTPLERHIFLNKSGDMAWFDELLDTRMGICRGSGVLEKEASGWKIAHYVLSIAVPNEHVGALVEIKKEQDSLQVLKLKKM